MLTTKDMSFEINTMEPDAKKLVDEVKSPEAKVIAKLLSYILKALFLNLKMQQSMRVNTVRIMEKFGIDPVKSKRPRDEHQTEQV